MHRTRRCAVASVLVLASLAFAACAPNPGDPPPAPDLRVPTMQEFVTTLRVYDEAPVRGDHADAVHDLVELTFGDLGPGAVSCMDGIIDGESGRRWNAYNRSGASGLTQLLGHQAVAERITGSSDVFNPWINLVTARSLWDSSGVRPWTPHRC